MAKKKSRAGAEAGVSNAVLRRMAGEENFHRGEDLFCHEHVLNWSEQPEGIAAQVRVERIYNPKLNVDDGMLDFSCDCATGQQGVLCMHAVAAAFAWRKGGELGAKRNRKPAKLSIAESVKHFLEASPEEMESHLLEWSSEDAGLRERLILYAAKRTGSVESAAALKTSFENAVKNRRHKMSARELTLYVKGLDQAIASLEKYCDEGHPAAVALLCRELLPFFDEHAGRVLYGEDIYSREQRIATLHHKACRQAPPDPIHLAQVLFHLERRGEFRCFVDASNYYSDLLGLDGEAEFRRLVEEAWNHLPAPMAGQRYWIAPREEPYLLRQMDRLARERKDWDGVIAIWSRYRNRPNDYLKLAKLALEAGKQDFAIQWASDGIAAFDVSETYELREFLTLQLMNLGRQGDAVDIALELYRQTGGQAHYRLLRTAAAGWPQWDELRGRIVDQIKRRMESGKLSDGTELAIVHAEDGEWTMVWELVRKLGCKRSFLDFAATKSPCREGIDAYFYAAGQVVEEAKTGDYRDAVAGIDGAWILARRIGQTEYFHASCENLKSRFPRRRAFLDVIRGRYTDA